MVKAYLGLGSNLGDRRENLEKALRAIAAIPHTELEEVSGIMESKAFGFDGADFLNCCCRIETDLVPQKLLEILKGIEQSMGRESKVPVYDADGRRIYSDRPIDIDILLYGDMKIDEENLQIPHPRMLERDFVMIPLNEIKKQ